MNFSFNTAINWHFAKKSFCLIPTITLSKTSKGFEIGLVLFVGILEVTFSKEK